MADVAVLVLFVAAPLAAAIGLMAVVRSYSRRPSTAKLVAGNLLVLLTLLATVFPVGELYYRYVYDTTDAYQASRVSARWVARHYRLNNVGVRDDIPYPPPAAARGARVLVVGDSFTNGHGVPDVEDRFANRMRAAEPDWAVELLAEDGLDTGALLDRLAGRLARGPAPDVVLYAYCLNDLSDLMPELDGPARELYRDRPPWIVRHSDLLDVWWWRLRIAGDPQLGRYFEQLARAYRDGRWARQVERLERFAAIVRDAGARPVVVTWPFFELLDDPEYRAIHRRLDSLWDRLDVPHRDLRPAFEGRPVNEWVVNPRDTHPNERAHAAATPVAVALVRQALRAGG